MLFPLTVFFARNLAAQSAASDTSFRSAAIQNMVAIYHKTTGSASNVYNGPQYEAYYPVFDKETHPFFNLKSFSLGAVLFDGVWYNNVPLLYDIIRDELVLQHFNTVSWVSLIKDKIEGFNLQGYRFIKIKKGNPFNLAEGFYNRLYAGGLTLLAKHRKDREEYIDQNIVLSKSFERTHYYVIKEGKIFSVKNKKTLLNVLGDKKNSLNQYIRQNRLSFKKEPEKAILQTVTYYDQSTR